jgi:hypothetical protein
MLAGQLQNETDLHFFEISTPPFSSQRGILLTPQIRTGYFWWITAIQIKDSDGNAQTFALLLISPEEIGKLRQDVPNAILGVPVPTASILVAPMTGMLGGASGWIAANQFMSTSDGGGAGLGSGCCPIWKDGSYVIPSGWALAVIELNNIPSGIVHNITLTFLYQEIRNEHLVPTMWD